MSLCGYKAAFTSELTSVLCNRREKIVPRLSSSVMTSWGVWSEEPHTCTPWYFVVVCTMRTQRFCLLVFSLKSHTVTLPDRPTDCQMTLPEVNLEAAIVYTCAGGWIWIQSLRMNLPPPQLLVDFPPLTSKSNAQTFIWQLDRCILHSVCSWKNQLLLGYHFGCLATGTKPGHVCPPPPDKARAKAPSSDFSFAYKHDRGALRQGFLQEQHSKRP